MAESPRIFLLQSLFVSRCVTFRYKAVSASKKICSAVSRCFPDECILWESDDTGGNLEVLTGEGVGWFIGVMFCCVRSGKGDGDEAFATGNGSIGLTADFFGNRVAAAESPRRFLLQNCPSQSARYASDCGTLRFQTAENQGHTMLNNTYNTLTNKPLRQHPRFFRQKQRVGDALWSLLTVGANPCDGRVCS